MSLSDSSTDDAQRIEKRQADTVLDIDSVSVEFSTESGSVQALRDVSVDIQRGETLGIAGESGSGKSTLALAIHQYLDENGEITQGSISFNGRDLQALSKGEIQEIRGNEIAHVPQDPKRSLNPSIRVGEQVAETIRRHQDVS
jgi:peptide/nickel transport system ATP-binding protein